MSIPIIIISGTMQTPELQRVVNMGITSVLQKPTVTSEFLAHVNKYLPKAPVKDVYTLSKGLRVEEAEEATASDEIVSTVPSHLQHVTVHSKASEAQSTKSLGCHARAESDLF